MFVQVVQGRVKDGDGFRKHVELWEQNLKPGSVGNLGATGGITEDGEFFIAARFESEAAAQKNSDRPEQGEWAAELMQYIEGEPSFINYDNVDLYRGGGSDDAGFVQVMQGKTNNPEKAAELDKRMEEAMGDDIRPDLIGGVAGKHDDGSFTSINYFTSEAEARKAESEGSAEFAEQMKEWESIIVEMRYIDLKDPWFQSA